VADLLAETVDSVAAESGSSGVLRVDQLLLGERAP
jgi:hypothetical protein